MGDPFDLLVGRQTLAATVESSMEIPPKLKMICLLTCDPTFGNISKGTQNTNLKEHKHPIFIAALFTIAKIWKLSRCPSVDEWIKQLWDIYTIEFYLAI